MEWLIDYEWEDQLTTHPPPHIRGQKQLFRLYVLCHVHSLSLHVLMEWID
jgi:hypothetical protein